MVIAEVLEVLNHNGQDRVSDYIGKLDAPNATVLAEQIKEIDVARCSSSFKRCIDKHENLSSILTEDNVVPISTDRVGGTHRSSPDAVRSYYETGLKEISECRVGALLLAGGQGTRLGVSFPKGEYDVGLPSHKTLFQLQAERILCLQRLAKEVHPASSPKIWFYIMTSHATHGSTMQFFQKNQNFGLDAAQIIYFKQGVMPCFDLQGKFIIESKNKLATAPDGNGGLYAALSRSGTLQHMIDNDVRHFHMYCVDNILVRVADPWFVGFCATLNADCGAKACQKASPEEGLGVICKIGDKPHVVEYSEIPKALAELRDEYGKLVYGLGSIANHYFSLDFLKRVCTNSEIELQCHVAKKKIPYYDAQQRAMVKPTEVNGVKLEKFVFDVFPFSNSFAVWEVDREAEFSPLKNPDSAKSCCPQTCRHDLFRLHRSWCLTSGAKLASPQVNVEVSPLISYAGENLANVVGSVGAIADCTHLKASSEK